MSEIPETVEHPAYSEPVPWSNRVKIIALGRPPSFNVMGTRGSGQALHREKKSWQEVFAKLLMAQAAGVKWAYVEAWATLLYERQLGRMPDEDNFRPLLAKALGDALDGGKAWRSVGGRWLPDDSNAYFRFRAVEFAVVRADDQIGLAHGGYGVHAPATVIELRGLHRCSRAFQVKGLSELQHCTLPTQHRGECRLLQRNPGRR